MIYSRSNTIQRVSNGIVHEDVQSVLKVQLSDASVEAGQKSNIHLESASTLPMRTYVLDTDSSDPLWPDLYLYILLDASYPINIPLKGLPLRLPRGYQVPDLSLLQPRQHICSANCLPRMYDVQIQGPANQKINVLYP